MFKLEYLGDVKSKKDLVITQNGQDFDEDRDGDGDGDEDGDGDIVITKNGSIVLYVTKLEKYIKQVNDEVVSFGERINILRNNILQNNYFKINDEFVLLDERINILRNNILKIYNKLIKLTNDLQLK